MNRSNWLLEKLKNGPKQCIGFWSVIPSIFWMDVLASTKPDFIIIDSEHGPCGFETALQLAIACENHKVSPVMRISGVNESECLKALDIGVHGLQVPNINYVDQAYKLIEYAKYAPRGNRGFSPFNRGAEYTSDNAPEKIRLANDNTLLTIHIEGQSGINNIDKLLEINDIDIYFIGLFDISNYLGIPGQTDHPKVISLLELLNNKIATAGKICGSISNTPVQLKAMVDVGIRYITHSVDCHIAKKAFSQIIEDFNNII